MSVPDLFKDVGVWASFMAAQLWCEKQLELRLIQSFGRTPPRESIRSLWLIKVLYEIRSGIENLLKHELTQELPTFGIINSIFIVGIIDELRLQNDMLFLFKNETRSTRKISLRYSQIPSEFQLMIYHKFLM